MTHVKQSVGLYRKSWRAGPALNNNTQNSVCKQFACASTLEALAECCKVGRKSTSVALLACPLSACRCSLSSSRTNTVTNDSQSKLAQYAGVSIESAAASQIDTSALAEFCTTKAATAVRLSPATCCGQLQPRHAAILAERSRKTSHTSQVCFLAPALCRCTVASASHRP